MKLLKVLAIIVATPFLLLCGVAVVVGLGRCASDDQQAQVASVDETGTPTAQPPQADTIDITAKALADAYEENEVYADNLYKGRTLRVTGTIRSISKSAFTDDPYIVLKGTGLRDVQVFTSSDGIANMRRGQKITATGVCDGLTVLNVVLK